MIYRYLWKPYFKSKTTPLERLKKCKWRWKNQWAQPSTAGQEPVTKLLPLELRCLELGALGTAAVRQTPRMYVCMYLFIYSQRKASSLSDPAAATEKREHCRPAARLCQKGEGCSLAGQEPAGAGSSCWAGPGPARGRLWAGPSRAEGGRRRRRAAGMAAPGGLQRSVVLPAGRHSASLIFLHGSGGCLLPSPLPPSLCGRPGARRAPLPAPRAPGHGGAEGRGGTAPGAPRLWLRLPRREPAPCAWSFGLVRRMGAQVDGKVSLLSFNVCFSVHAALTAGCWPVPTGNPLPQLYRWAVCGQDREIEKKSLRNNSKKVVIGYRLVDSRPWKFVLLAFVHTLKCLIPSAYL